MQHAHSTFEHGAKLQAVPDRAEPRFEKVEMREPGPNADAPRFTRATNQSTRGGSYEPYGGLVGGAGGVGSVCGDPPHHGTTLSSTTVLCDATLRSLASRRGPVTVWV
jgi:hypothetical protein